MRGPDERQAMLFSYRSIEDRIPADHPLRALRRSVKRGQAGVLVEWPDRVGAVGYIAPNLAPEGASSPLRRHFSAPC
jgi:hypothetical protein